LVGGAKVQQKCKVQSFSYASKILKFFLLFDFSAGWEERRTAKNAGAHGDTGLQLSILNK